MRKYIASVTTGKIMKMGTNHYIEYYVYRELKFGKPRWVLYKACCDGTCEGSEVFKTRKAALSALNAYKEA